jgi:hypothetical protein
MFKNVSGRFFLPELQQPTLPKPVSVILTHVWPVLQQTCGEPMLAQETVPEAHWNEEVALPKIAKGGTDR